MIKFLGSVYFSLILIATVAVIVIFGTFVESYTTSHLFAARLSYGNPLFGLLLWCFFLNIFISTLLRWPFKLKHIPFIITHLGLLMILSGQLVKHYYGIQGVMQIAEGCSSCEYFTEHSQALEITDRQGVTRQVKIHNQKIDTDNEGVKLVSYHPNGTEKFQGWIHGGSAKITGLPEFPVHLWKPSAPLPKPITARLHHSDSMPWNIFAIKTDEIDELLKELKPHQPFLLLLGNENPEAIWVTIGGNIHRHNIDPSSSIAMYDEGFGGYTTSLQVPFSNFIDTSEAYRDALIHALTVQLRLQRDHPESLIPPLKLIYDASETASVSFVEATINFLDAWDKSGAYIFTEAANTPLLQIVLNQINERELNILLAEITPELATSAKILNKSGLLSLSLKAYGVELSKFSPPDQDRLLKEYYASCFFCDNAKRAVPKIEKLTLDERVSFLQSFPLDAEDFVALRKAYVNYVKTLAPDLPQNAPPPLAEIIEAIRLLPPIKTTDLKLYSADFSAEMPRIESPLIHQLKPKKSKSKLEDNRPIATFELADATSKERLSLIYDPSGYGLRWPTHSGNFTARFQPHFQKLPHTIKLRQARQINYAHSNQPYSFEADLWIEPEHIPVTLSMNEVYETDDGFRFYLAGITPQDPGTWKKVQIVVNKDPTKYWLTYPGAALLMLGASLLFFLRKRL